MTDQSDVKPNAVPVVIVPEPKNELTGPPTEQTATVAAPVNVALEVAPVRNDFGRILLPIIGFLLLAVAVIAPNYDFRPSFKRSSYPDATLNCKDVKSATRYTPVVVDGVQVGVAKSVTHQGGEYPAKVVIEFWNEAVVPRACDAEAEWFVDVVDYRSINDIGSAGRVMSGPAFVCYPAKEAKTPCLEFNVENAALPPKGEKFFIDCRNAGGMRVQNLCVVDGGPVGRITRMVPVDAGWKVTGRLDDTDGLAQRIFRTTTKIYVMKFGADLRGTFGEEAALARLVVIVPGNPNDPYCNGFTLEEGQPPPREITADSVRMTGWADNSKKLATGAKVTDLGVPVGIVERVGVVQERGKVKIDIALYTTDKNSVYCKVGTRWHVYSAEVTIDKLEVNPMQILAGTELVVEVDPCDNSPQRRLTFECEPSTEPMPITAPRPGEEPWFVFSPRAIPRTMPFVVLDEVAGRVHNCKMLGDAGGFLVEFRVFKNYQPLVYTNSKVFIQQRFSFKILEWKKWFDFRGPQLEVPSNDTLTNPGIELVTPPLGIAGAPINWTSLEGRPRFDIHAKPEKDWTTWRKTVATGEVRDKAPDMVGLDTVSLRYKWYYLRAYWPGKDFTVWTKGHESIGRGIVIPGGVLGVEDLLKPPGNVEDKRVNQAKVEFDLDGEAWKMRRQKPPLESAGSSLRLMKLYDVPDCKGKVIPLDRLAAPGSITNIYLLRSAGVVSYVPKEKLEAKGAFWELAADAGYDLECHGVPAVCGDPGPQFGKIIGMLSVTPRGKNETPLAQLHVFTSDGLKSVKEETARTALQMVPALQMMPKK